MTHDDQPDPWSQLRAHWTESAERERANPPPDRPSHEWMVQNANRNMSAAPASGCYVIENDSRGVHFATRDKFGFWVHDAGDLWPSDPVAWWPVNSWPARAEGRVIETETKQ